MEKRKKSFCLVIYELGQKARARVWANWRWKVPKKQNCLRHTLIFAVCWFFCFIFFYFLSFEWRTKIDQNYKRHKRFSIPRNVKCRITRDFSHSFHKKKIIYMDLTLWPWCTLFYTIWNGKIKMSIFIL